MENASKALIMAAGVLIGILIISLGVYLFLNFGSAAAEVHKKVKDDQLQQFNSQYMSYSGREDLTIHDVITVANRATQNNIYYELEATSTNRNDDKSFYISVYLDDTKIEEGKSEFIEKGYNKNIVNNDIDKVNDDNEILINRHVKAMINPLVTPSPGSTSGKSMPKITCTSVETSKITSRVHKIRFEVK